jgi:hypothetical protein
MNCALNTMDYETTVFRNSPTVSYDVFTVTKSPQKKGSHFWLPSIDIDDRNTSAVAVHANHFLMLKAFIFMPCSFGSQ